MKWRDEWKPKLASFALFLAFAIAAFANAGCGSEEKHPLQERLQEQSQVADQAWEELCETKREVYGEQGAQEAGC